MSSYLKYNLTATIKTEFDLAEETKQIQKIFNNPEVKLLTEADFTWKKNDREKAFHMFRLDSREYLVLITPVGRAPPADVPDRSLRTGRERRRSIFWTRNSPFRKRTSPSSDSRIRRATRTSCRSAFRDGHRRAGLSRAAVRRPRRGPGSGDGEIKPPGSSSRSIPFILRLPDKRGLKASSSWSRRRMFTAASSTLES